MYISFYFEHLCNIVVEGLTGEDPMIFVLCVTWLLRTDYASLELRYIIF